MCSDEKKAELKGWWRRWELNLSRLRAFETAGEILSGAKDLVRNEFWEIWWRRWELNPRPKILTAERLHACSVHATGITPQLSPNALTNGQETHPASLIVSPSLHRRSSEDQPAVRRPFAAHG